MANQKKGKDLWELMRTQSKNNQRLKARENAADQVAIILSSESDWLRKWGEFSGPITEKKT